MNQKQQSGKSHTLENKAWINIVRMYISPRLGRSIWQIINSLGPYVKFPRIIQWFCGNIGFHHIHHLSPEIPNYNLEKCHTENSMFDQVKPVTLPLSFRTLRLRLWDEAGNRLISFRELKKIPVPAK